MSYDYISILINLFTSGLMYFIVNMVNKNQNNIIKQTKSKGFITGIT